MNFEIIPAYEIPFAEQVNVFNQAFQNYLAGWHDLDVPGLARFLSAQGVDVCYSRFVRANGELVGFGYINRTAGTPRLAGMGTIPRARRSGAAGSLLMHLLSEAKDRGDRAMVLEVFEQNEPAVKMYQRHGFQIISRLLGWRRGPAAQEEAPALEQMSLLEASHRLRAPAYPDVPWQISSHAVAKVPVAHAFRVKEAGIVLGDTKAGPIRIHACFADDANEKAARNGLAAVMSHYPGREFFAPPIFPEQFGAGIFQPLGFQREPLNQLLMRRDL
jgi:ribosomal protein S18 acetylase RimI-like enzyme